MAVGRRIAAGELIAGYEVGALAGRGGMGEVYRALDVRLERPVALKLLGERLSDDEGFRERMLRESRLAASLDHPNVVPIYEAGEADGRLFIAMRYVDGSRPQGPAPPEGALEPARAVAIAGQVADALDAAHEERARPPRRQAVQRPARPAGRPGACYLADFGLTQSARPRPSTGSAWARVDYVAPEQIRGDQVDCRADVYALGCLLFETLTGTLPFSGASDVAALRPPRGGAAARERAAARARARDRRDPGPRDGEGPGRAAANVRPARRRGASRARPRRA